MTKAPEEQIAQAMSTAGPVPSALRVTVPPELQGVAFISVLCQKGNYNKMSDAFCQDLYRVMKGRQKSLYFIAANNTQRNSFLLSSIMQAEPLMFFIMCFTATEVSMIIWKL